MRMCLDSFFDELEKISGIGSFVAQHKDALSHGTEIAGLGILAKPSIDRLRGKDVSERRAAKWDTAGLGLLAAPSAISLAHHLKGIAKRASYRPVPGSLKASLMEASRRLSQPHPPTRIAKAVSPPERAGMLQHFTQMAGGGRPRVGPGKPALELPPMPKGPFIIER
jgi:hypothetical protein